MTTPTPHPSANLAELRAHWRALADAATPGPWTSDTVTRGDCVLWGPDGKFVANAQSEPHWVPNPDGSKRAVMFDVDRRDMDFVAAARTAVPALLDALTTAERELAEAERHIERGNDETMRAYSKLRTAEAQPRKAIGDELMAEARRYAAEGYTELGNAYRGAALFVMGGGQDAPAASETLHWTETRGITNDMRRRLPAKPCDRVGRHDEHMHSVAPFICDGLGLTVAAQRERNAAAPHAGDTDGDGPDSGEVRRG